MTLEKAYELIRTQAMMGGGYNRNGATDTYGSLSRARPKSRGQHDS